jgi:hypothetical protein
VEGYFVEVVGGHLVVRYVPYVNSEKRVMTGTLISSLNLAGEETLAPDTHVLFFDGDYPCSADGTALLRIANQSGNYDLGSGLKARHKFSSKPDGGYKDYHHKMSTYATIIAGPAAQLAHGVTARVFRSPEDEEQSVFQYAETASGRVGIGAVTAKLAGERVAIVGLGGTGGYILDQLAKTPVEQIRLFDADDFLQHNAFRAPGAASIEDLRKCQKKVDYFKEVYSRMHKGIVANAVAIEESNLHLLDEVTFAFLCMDAGDAKQLIVRKLESLNASFVDCGMGLELNGGAIGGIVRCTSSVPERRVHVHNGRVSFAGGGEKDLYASNIQVADLNNLNAIFAVIKWKKLRGFYHDFEHELHSTYTLDSNLLLNNEVKDADIAA